ncbi:MAG TPA: hypothetical protein VJS43_06590, partial [Candidatus Acidoferrales bacterium]|nr:hypothetical protein [Candidatus Acidoferrales bacterium]
GGVALCRILHGQYPQSEHTPGVPSGVQPVSRLVRGSRPHASRDPGTRRRDLYRGVAGRGAGALGQAAARGDPHAV